MEREAIRDSRGDVVPAVHGEDSPRLAVPVHCGLCAAFQHSGACALLLDHCVVCSAVLLGRLLFVSKFGLASASNCVVR
jgi:hypothetical protein